MRHPLDGARAKHARALEHTNTLNAESTEFIGRQPYEIVPKNYPKTCHKTYRFLEHERPDATRWGLTFGDALHNLSSALDHVAWQLALRDRTNPSRHTAWPVCVKEGEWESKRTRAMLQHIAADGWAFIKSKQPYPTPHGERPETHAFAFLRELSRIDKHRVLHTAVLSPSDTDVELLNLTDPRRVPIITFYDKPVRQGAKFVRLVYHPDDAQVEMNTTVSIYIALRGPEYGWMDRGAVFTILRAILTEVEKAIDEASILF